MGESLQMPELFSIVSVANLVDTIFYSHLYFLLCLSILREFDIRVKCLSLLSKSITK